MIRLAIALALWLSVTAAALAQNATVIGPITPGDCTMFSSTTVLKDGGIPCPGSGGTLNLPNGTTATTQSPFSDNTTKVATDAFVQGAISLNSTHFAAGGTSTGSANAQVIATVSPPVFSLTGNPTVTFIAGFSNTGATTLNVASSGVINILKRTQTGLVALVTGDIIASQQYLVTYDGTQYELQTPTLGTFSGQNFATPPAIGGTTPAAGSFSSVTDTAITGSTQCVQANTSGVLSGAGTSCGSATSVLSFGAVGDCVTDDTTAFNNAITAAFSASKRLYIPKPPAGSCYAVGAINQTAKPGMYVFGDGDVSVVKVVNFSPTNHNWWDLTGSTDTTFDNFKVLGSSGVVPKVLFFAAADSTVNILRGINFHHVNIDAYSSEGHLYAFNIAYNNGVTYSGGAGGLTCSNSIWYQRANGGAALTANPSLRTAVAIFDGINSRSLASDYATVSASGAGSQSINLTNCNFISYPPAGVGSGTKDANSGLVLVTVGQFEMTNGSVQCLSLACVVIYTNTEGASFRSVVLKNSDGLGGANATTNYYVYFGGGTNGFFVLDNLFFSDLPNAAGNAGFLALDVTATQVAHLKVRGPDIGGNTFSNKFITTVGGCGGHTAATNQIYQSRIEFWDVNNAMQMCDSIDKNTEMVGLGALTQVSAGATDASMHIGGALPSVGFATLPTCNAASYGARRLINNSNTAVFNAGAAAGGANVVYVMCNATAWVVF